MSTSQVRSQENRKTRKMNQNPPAKSIHGNQTIQTPNTTPSMMMMTNTKTALWNVQYARFFTFPQHSHQSTISKTTSNTSSLRPMYPRKKRRLKGTWVPSSSSHASLRIVSRHSEVALAVSCAGSVYEEHYVSKLHFTCPKVSSPSGCCVRGSRVIFASYRDSTGQTQKFAVRFSSATESEAFMNLLMYLKGARDVECLSGVSSSLFHQRPAESSNYVVPSEDCTPLRRPSIRKEHISYSCGQQAMLSHAVEGTDVSLPPSFTALLSDFCTTNDPGVPEAPIQQGLNNVLNAGSMTDSHYAFMDMLDNIENVIIGLGGDLAF